MTVRRVAVLVAVLVLGAVLAVVFGGTEVTGRPVAKEYDEITPGATAVHCRSQGKAPQVIVRFMADNPDAAMQSKAEELAGDERFESIEQETQAQAYERFKVIFADEPELLEVTTPESLPAALWLTPADGLTATALHADLEDELTDPAIDSLAISCRD